jgi:hypothetical protein
MSAAKEARICPRGKSYVLVDQDNRNVLSLSGKRFKSALDCGCLGLGVDDKVVLLRVWRVGDMLYRGESVSFFKDSATTG